MNEHLEPLLLYKRVVSLVITSFSLSLIASTKSHPPSTLPTSGFGAESRSHDLDRRKDKQPRAAPSCTRDTKDVGPDLGDDPNESSIRNRLDPHDPSTRNAQTGNIRVGRLRNSATECALASPAPPLAALRFAGSVAAGSGRKQPESQRYWKSDTRN